MSGPECDDFVKEHPVEVCRNVCAEAAFSPEGFKSCVEACVEELRKRCS